MGTKKSNKLYAAAAALAVTASAVAPGLSADAATKVTVKSVVNPASISHYGGYANSVKKLSLPKTVKVMLSNKKTENRSVKWGKVAYDAKYVGKYQTITGTVSGTSLKATIKVKLNNYPVDVVEPKLAPVAVGEEVKLPSTITVKYKDGKSIARSIKSFTISKADTSKAGKMKLSYSYKGLNLEIKGSIAYEVKSAEITNVKGEVKEDMLSVAADVKYPAKNAKAQLLIFPGKDESKALPAIDGKLENGKFMAEGKMIPAGTHSFAVKVGDVVSPATEFSVEALKATVKAVSSKTLEVNFNRVVDSSKAVVELKKDGFKVNAASITPSADKKSLIVELTSKITKGEYAVSLSGLSEKALEASVKTEDEKVAGIQVLSDIAPIVAAGKAQVGYKVANQYGEDITKFYGPTLVASVPGGTATPNADGTIALNIANVKKDDKVVLTLIDQQTATTTTKTVTVSAESMAADVEFGAIYNKDGKVLSENSDLSKDKFYLPVNVKDQYGDSVKTLSRLNGDKSEILFTNTNAGVATFGDFELQTINGKEVVVLPVSKVVAAGDTNVIVIAKANGKNAQSTVKVTEGLRTDAVSIGAPTSIVTAGKDILFPLSVLDKEGKAVTDLNVLKGANGVKIPEGYEFLNKDGAVYIKVAGASVKEGSPITVVATSSTNKVATQTVIPKAASVARVITGLKSGVDTALRTNATLELAPTDFVIEDQYGQTLSDEDVKNLDIVATSDVQEAFSEKNTEVADAADTIILTAGNNATKLSANVTFKLKGKNESAFTKKFTVVRNSDFASYKVADLAPIFLNINKDIPTKYDRSIVVKAVTASGNEVTLKEGANSDYTVKSTLLSGVADSKINGDDAEAINIAANETTAKAKVTITINATGEEIVKEVTFSNVLPKVEKVDVIENAKADAFIKGDAVKAVTVADYTNTVDARFGLTQFFGLADVVVTDQYGVKNQVIEQDDTKTETTNEKGQVLLGDVLSGQSTLTFTKVSSDVIFTDNGTANAHAAGNSADAFNVRYNLNGNSASPIKVTAKQKFSAQ